MTPGICRDLMPGATGATGKMVDDAVDPYLYGVSTLSCFTLDASSYRNFRLNCRENAPSLDIAADNAMSWCTFTPNPNVPLGKW